MGGTQRSGGLSGFREAAGMWRWRAVATSSSDKAAGLGVTQGASAGLLARCCGWHGQIGGFHWATWEGITLIGLSTTEVRLPWSPSTAMAPKKGGGKSESKRPTPKAPPKHPVLALSSSDEEEDVAQQAILEPLFTLEEAMGVAAPAPVSAQTKGAKKQASKTQFQASLLTRLSLLEGHWPSPVDQGMDSEQAGLQMQHLPVKGTLISDQDLRGQLYLLGLQAHLVSPLTPPTWYLPGLGVHH
ncbi:UNVERIFIED_CONTAM: hypothetical protein K2H54_005301 [Gekko kuhli]